jgi:hypothetical protein
MIPTIIIFILLIFYINNVTIGLKNLFLNRIVKFYYVIKGIFNENKFIELLKSYDFIINKNKNKIVIDYKLYKNIINFEIIQNIENYKIIVEFNHIYFDIQGVHKIINNYLNNNMEKKNMIICKNIYKNDLYLFNVLLIFIRNYNKPFKYEKIIITNEYIMEKKNKSKNYISKIDVIMGFFSKKYLLQYNKKSCNLLFTKSDKTIKNNYLGNPVTYHLISITNDKNIEKQIRNSYKQNNLDLTKYIDIYMTSWINCENTNKIEEINRMTNKHYKQMKTNYSIILCMKNNDFIVHLFYF